MGNAVQLPAPDDNDIKNQSAEIISKTTEADLHSRFLGDIVQWLSLRNRVFVPLPLGESQPDANGVFASGINCSVKKSLIEGGGRGLFANRFVKKGSVVEFFDGRIVEDRSVKEFQETSKAFCSHCITLVNYLWVMDCTATLPSAVQEMKGASFANSSVLSNTKVKLKHDRRALSIVACLVAKHDIQAGDEITFNYRLGC